MKFDCLILFQATIRHSVCRGLGGMVCFVFLISSAEAQSNLGATPPSSAHSPPQNKIEPYDPLKSCIAPKKEIYPKKLQEYQEALAKNPKDSEFHYYLGVLQSRLQQWEDSQKSFFQALAHTQDQQLVSKIYHELGNIYVCQRKFENAIAQYKQTLRRNPQAVETKHNLALTQLLAHQEKQQKTTNPQQQTGDNQEKTNPQRSSNPENQQQGTEEKTNPQRSSNPENKQKETAEEDIAQKDNPKQPKPSEQESEGDAQQDPSEKQANSMEKKDATGEESEENSPSGKMEQDQNEAQAALSLQKAEQLINTTPENRRKFIERLIQRQNLPPDSSGKNW